MGSAMFFFGKSRRDEDSTILIRGVLLHRCLSEEA